MNPTMKLLMLTREPDERSRDQRGRERYDNGRYAPKSELDTYHYPHPAREERERDTDEKQIGFVPANNRETSDDYRGDAAYSHTDEAERRALRTSRGRSAATDTLTYEMAEEWMQGLHNEDGTKGPHWTKEQTSQVMKQKGIKADPLDFHVVMNALYGDYCSVLKKHGVNNIDFYVDLAAAWLNDKDAKEGKTARYFQYIAK